MGGEDISLWFKYIQIVLWRSSLFLHCCTISSNNLEIFSPLSVNATRINQTKLCRSFSQSTSCPHFCMYCSTQFQISSSNTKFIIKRLYSLFYSTLIHFNPNFIRLIWDTLPCIFFILNATVLVKKKMVKIKQHKSKNIFLLLQFLGGRFEEYGQIIWSVGWPDFWDFCWDCWNVSAKRIDRWVHAILEHRATS